MTKALEIFEILTGIFQFLGKRRNYYNLDPSCHLTRCALVNKVWLSAARQELYSYVYLNTYDGLEDCLMRFWETISKSPHLALRVRTLNFGLEYVYHGVTADLAKVIASCPNLTSIRIYGLDNNALEDLVGALKSRSRLESLEISPYTFGSLECNGLCDMGTFLGILQCWPNMRSVLVHENGLFEEPGKGEIEVTRNACPYLRRFDFRSEPMPAERHFVTLSQIAPSLSELRLRGPLVGRKELQHALRTWATTITELRLDFSGPTFSGTARGIQSNMDCHLDDIITLMPALRYLTISTHYLRPSTLTHDSFKNLETLIYDMMEEELREFVGILRQPGLLPALQQLAVSARMFQYEFEINMVEEMKAECRRRGVAVHGRFFEEKRDNENFDPLED
ncbi:hypothetical protein EVG20_g3004 [Dentipellis fragilis]|uniref:F-box domain-containing protein n=1 Tax=Dentipellis fragilis TaxID=205917 RepID=A0A4Y9Z7G6_9AGAM|nr:hypothetical protein EVG20_g3004 [Dentipellis fragilis]